MSDKPKKLKKSKKVKVDLDIPEEIVQELEDMLNEQDEMEKSVSSSTPKNGIVKLKRTNFKGLIPNEDQIADGELILNTEDKRIFMKGNDGKIYYMQFLPLSIL